ncbi:MAG: cation:proton antiporter [Bacteroidales bacterium]|nr:cation:proton antiporter [Bacteroidales bacterium]
MNILAIFSHFDYLPLLVVAAVAWLTPLLMTVLRLRRIPTVIMEIVIGFVIGKFLFSYFTPESTDILDFLAFTGFMFLMFLSGLEIDMDQIVASLPRRRLTMARFLSNPFLVGFSIFILTVTLSYGGAIVMRQYIPMQNTFYFALIMITTSVGIIIPVLKERGEISSRFGQMIVLAAVIADILSIILFSFTAFILKNGFQPEILLILGIILLFFVFYSTGILLKRIPLIKKLIFQLSEAASQITVRGTMLMLLIFIVLAQFIGREVMLLGAFLGGLLLSVYTHKARSLLLLKLDGMGYGFFIPVFFVMVGIRFDPSLLAGLESSLFLFLALFLITLYAVKVIPSLIWTRLFGVRKALAGGFLISSRLSLIIAASAIGLQMELISPEINAAVILMAIITCIVSPILYNLISPKALMPADKLIIVGGSSSAVLLARRFKMHSRETVIIELDQKRFRDIEEKGLHAFHGDGKDPEVYVKLKLIPANYVIVLTESEEENISICELLRNHFAHNRIIAVAPSRSVEQMYNRMGVETIDLLRTVVTTIENLILRPTTYHTLVETFESFSVEEIEITSRACDGLQVKEIPFHHDGSLMLVKRKNNIYVPHGDTQLRLGDTVIALGTQSALDQMRGRLQ